MVPLPAAKERIFNDSIQNLHILRVMYSALHIVDFITCDVIVVSSLKWFISRFLLLFVYFKEF